MRARQGAAALSVVIALGVFVAPQAHAGDMALNGRFLATSNGDWAMTNDVYRDEASVRSIWTIAMTCTNVLTCAERSTVTSAGAPKSPRPTGNTSSSETFQTGSHAPTAAETVTGHQRYRFFPVDDNGAIRPGSRVFAGFDKTSGESGGCSLNEKLEIEIPFRLEKLD